MLEYLEQLRNKPAAQRKKVAVFSAAVISGVILVIWVSTLNFDSSSLVDSKALGEGLKPLEEIKTSAVNLYQSVIQAGASMFNVAATSSSETSATN